MLWSTIFHSIYCYLGCLSLGLLGVTLNLRNHHKVAKSPVVVTWKSISIFEGRVNVGLIRSWIISH